MSGAAPGERPAGAGAQPGRVRLGMFSPLSAFVVAAPATVPLGASVRATLELMARRDAGSVVVTDAGGRIPLGMFTLQDLVRRVTLPGGGLEQPVAAVMTGGLITLPPQATAHHAALTMARSGVQRVVVVDAEGRLAGVVSQADLFGLQQAGVAQVSEALGAARDVEGLRAAAAGIRRVTEALLAQGVGVEAISQATSTMNDLLAIRVLELAADDHDVPPVPFCWIALGSEGRLEQTFATDQDNGIIFDAAPADADRVREGLLPFARAANERLGACGFALCKGQVMASNPRWCLTLEEWQRTFSRWIHVPEPEALLNAAIFFDLRPVHGNPALAERLRSSLLEEAGQRPIFLRVMAENALACRPPLGTLRDFVTDRSSEHPGTLDLKLAGSRPFVDAARILALAHGVAHTATAERLRAVQEVTGQRPEAFAAVVDAFHVVHRLRLLSQCGPRPGPAPNRLDPDTLNDLDRHLLKEALRQARRLQEWLARDYDLG